MHYKRVIPCLDVDGGRVVKGVGFVELRDAGDPVELACRYDTAGADELVFLDITATSDKRETVVELAKRTADDVFIPFTIGGGIRSVADAQAVLDAGADKISINSAALARPELIDELAQTFGAQCAVELADAGDISARPVEARHHAELDRIGAHHEHDWNGRRRLLRRERRRQCARENDGYLPAYQLGGECRQSLVVTLRPTEFDRDVVTFHETTFI